MIQQLTVIGAMSGTSLDGLDLCCVQFNFSDPDYSFEIIAAETFEYNTNWQNRLAGAMQLSKGDLDDLDKTYGQFTGQLIRFFMLKHGIKNKVDLIGSHGHTVFHEPDKGITLQIGSGVEIVKKTKKKVINDFRTLDVQLGGQGAPLVPIGDRHLFGQYDACLNLGGIANISYEKNDSRIAFDICPANLPLNKIVREKFGIQFDRNGEIAASGKIIAELLDELNQIVFYQSLPPKSLGVEWMNKYFYPRLEAYQEQPIASILRTIVEHETHQIAKILEQQKLSSCLITGGGALNSFFAETLRKKTTCQLVIPESDIVEFKEALIFAFLAYLKLNDQVNTLASVTGAKQDSVGGVLHLPTE